MLSNHLICWPPLFLPSIFPSIRIYSNESPPHSRWPKYWKLSFSLSPSSEYSLDFRFQLLIAKFRFKLKKGKTTRPFRYDINQIPYDYTVEVMNRFRGLAHVTNLNPSRPAPTGNTSQLRKPHVHIKIFQLSFV